MVTVADKKRPYKVYAAIALTFLSSILLTNATDLGPWGIGIITAVIAGLGVYITPNPLVHLRDRVPK